MKALNKIIIFTCIFSGLLFRSAVFAQGPKELVVIDENMENSEDLIKGVKKDIEVVVLKKDGNQLEELTQKLENYKDLDAIHLMICGEDGVINFQGAPVQNDNLSSYMESLAKWKESFKSGGDLLIYTCNLAGSNEGKLVVRRLSAYTGLDVAASTNRTGNYSDSTDWILEFMKGDVKAEFCFDENLIGDFKGTVTKEK